VVLGQRLRVQADGADEAELRQPPGVDLGPDPWPLHLPDVPTERRTPEQPGPPGRRIGP
jgi:hypothetical protein